MEWTGRDLVLDRSDERSRLCRHGPALGLRTWHARYGKPLTRAGLPGVGGSGEVEALAQEMVNPRRGSSRRRDGRGIRRA